MGLPGLCLLGSEMAPFPSTRLALPCCVLGPPYSSTRHPAFHSDLCRVWPLDTLRSLVGTAAPGAARSWPGWRPWALASSPVWVAPAVLTGRAPGGRRTGGRLLCSPLTGGLYESPERL